MRLGIFLPSWIGDTCMATPALRAIRQGLPNAHIVGVSRPGPMALLKNSPFIDSWVLQPTGSCAFTNKLALVRTLKDAQIDAMLLMTNSLGTAMVTWAAGIPRRVGYARDMRSFFLTERVTAPTHVSQTEPSLIESYLKLTLPLGVQSDDHRMELHADPCEVTKVSDTLRANGLDRRRPLVVVNNSAQAARSRLWPSQYVVHLCQQIVAQLNAQVLLHCGPNDRDQANTVCEQVNNPLVQSMGEWNDLPLSTSLAVLSLADVVVTTDSGPRHVAAALNRQVVSLFGSTDPQKTRTFNSQETILESFQECRPCYKLECPLKHHRCMRNIEVDTVRIAVQQALQTARTFQLSKAA